MTFSKYDKILLSDQKYRENDNNGIKTTDNNFCIINGNIPVLLSAPHSVKTVRENRLKSSDILTGGIVEYICQQCNTFGITRIFNNNDDPNYYNTGISLEYKNAAIDLINSNNINFLFDIHGCKDEHPFEIEIGTNYSANLNNPKTYEIVRNAFSNIASVSIDNTFMASSPANISNYIHFHTNIDCIQIEICKSIRTNPQRLMQFVDSFSKMISDLCQAVP